VFSFSESVFLCGSYTTIKGCYFQATYFYWAGHTLLMTDFALNMMVANMAAATGTPLQNINFSITSVKIRLTLFGDFGSFLIFFGTSLY